MERKFVKHKKRLAVIDSLLNIVFKLIVVKRGKMCRS